jgi:hypothetical protein
MAYTAPGTVTAGDVATAAAWNVVVNDVIDHESRILKTGLVFVSSSTFSAATTVSVDSVFSSTYANYRIIIGASTTAVAGVATISAVLRIGGVSTATNYDYVRTAQTSTPTTTISTAQGGANWPTFFANGTTASSQPAYYTFDLFAPNLAAWTNFSALGFYANNLSSSEVMNVYGGHQMSTTQFDGIGFTSATAVSGTIRIYGYLNS